MLSTEFLIAWRYIKSKRKEKAISAIAAFSLMGIALGVAALIIVMSVMNGFRKEFTERVIGFNGHITIYTPEQPFDYETASSDVLAIVGVLQAVPAIERHALIAREGIVRAALCLGISHKNLVAKSLIAKNIMHGDLQNFKNEDDDAIVLGDSIANRLHMQIGDKVVLIAPELDETGLGFMQRKKTFRLVATFKSGMHEYDSSVSFIPLAMSQKLFKMPSAITNISVFVNNPMELSRIRREIVNKAKFQYESIVDWQNSNNSFMKAVEIERNVMFLILALIILVASFNIIACMIMLVKDKEKDIAILKTIGLTQLSITRIFFIVGASIGTLGTAAGACFGLLFAVNIKRIQEFLEIMLHTQVFSPEVYFLTHMPSLIRPLDVVVTIVVSMLLSCLATLYPARKASKLDPTTILRYT